MDKVRVTVQTSFTYEYGSRANHVNCGAILYYNPSLEKELDELKFVMSSVYLKRGFVSVEESIKEDFKNKAGIFAEKTIVSEQVPTPSVVKEEVTEVAIPEVENNLTVIEEPSLLEEVPALDKISLEDRKIRLEEMKAIDIKSIAESLGIIYANKASAIDSILKVEYFV